MEREKAHWERGREQWVRENRREEEEGEGRRKVGGPRGRGVWKINLISNKT